MDAADVLGVRQATTASHPCPAVVDEAASEDHALVERTMNHRSIIDRVRSDDCELLQREIFLEALYYFVPDAAETCRPISCERSASVSTR